MPLNKTQNIWIIAAVTGAIIAAGLFFWILPRTQAITGQVATLQRQRAEIDVLQKKSASGKEQKSFDLYTADADQLKSAAVSEGSVITLIEILESLANETSVSTQFSVQGQDSKKTTPATSATPDQKNTAQTTAAAPTSEVKLQLVLSGAWPNLLAMLNKIENLPAVVDVTDFTVHGTQGSSGTPTDTKAPTNTGSPTASLSLTIPLFN